MRGSFKILLILLVVCNNIVSQVITKDGFDQTGFWPHHTVSDLTEFKQYADSLKRIINSDLLTGYVLTVFHEIAPPVEIKYSINGDTEKTSTSDLKGRFYIPYKGAINNVRLQIDEGEYYALDSTFINSSLTFPAIVLLLQPKHKILLRGRIYAGNVPIENVNVEILYNSKKYQTKTLSCYTDDENYWNCLYLGMFKQKIIFDDASDSIQINLYKEGFKSQSTSMLIKDYNGTILNYKLKYTKRLVKFPRHNIGLKYGLTFQNIWSVSANYTWQIRVGNFNRLGLGINSLMLINNITTEHSTFRNLPQAQVDTSYFIGMIGPRIYLSVTDPSIRFFNVYAGIDIPYLMPKNKIALQPFLGSKFYIDLNKALFIEFKYLNYTIDVVHYVFEPYGNADRYTKEEEFQKLLVNIGLLVSF